MVSKALKYELITLFVLTFCSFCAFYFQERLPDNILEISSLNSSMNFFTYSISSFIAVQGFYVGPWIFFPFFIYAILYTFLYSTREYYFDVLNAILISIFSLCCAALFFPIMLGEGLQFLLKTRVNSSIVILLLPISFAGFLACTFREGFFEKCKLGYNKVGSYFSDTIYPSSWSVFFINSLNKDVGSL